MSDFCRLKHLESLDQLRRLWGPQSNSCAVRKIGVPPILDDLFHGKSHENGWFRGSPISGNLHFWILDDLPISSDIFQIPDCHLGFWRRIVAETNRQSVIPTASLMFVLRPINLEESWIQHVPWKRLLRSWQWQCLGFPKPCESISNKTPRRVQLPSYTAIPRSDAVSSYIFQPIEIPTVSNPEWMDQTFEINVLGDVFIYVIQPNLFALMLA